MKYLENTYLGPYQTLFLKRLPNSKGIFKCSFCGKEFETFISNITRGHTKSCGCYSAKRSSERAKENNPKRRLDLENKRFGYLVALYPTDERQCGGIVWVCKCDCGNIVKVRSADLTRGHNLSCGCKRISKGELKIQNILQELNIRFQKEKTFKGCFNPKTNFPLRFDFYLPDYNCCIEFDGQQHFYQGCFNDSLEDRQYKDNIKNIYCKDNNIKLIRIKYTDLNKINTEMIKNYL